jgi:hypothetical protein
MKTKEKRKRLGVGKKEQENRCGQSVDQRTRYFQPSESLVLFRSQCRYIDKLIFSEQHLGHWGPCEEKYHCARIDPCGLFGVLPSTLQMLLGAVAGCTFQLYASPNTRQVHLLAWAAAEVP